MDALKDRVFNERIRILKAQLEIALRQRDVFAENYHSLVRTPHQERHEIIEDCNLELEDAKLALPGFND